MKKLILCILFMVAFNSHAMAAKLYLLDGTSAEFDDVIAQELLNDDGWYTEPMAKLTTPTMRESRIETISEAERLDGYRGLYIVEITPMFNKKGGLYNADAKRDNIEALAESGWMVRVTNPDVTPVPDGKIRMYTKNREWAIDVDKSSVTAFERKGWYASTTVYYVNGERKQIMNAELEAELAKGGYTAPVTTVYKPDGSQKIIYKSEVEKYKTTGWYAEPMMTVYHVNGNTKVIKKSEKGRNPGWYSYPVVTLYNTAGAEEVVPLEKKDAYLLEGWYTKPHKTVYAADGRSEIILESDVEAWKKVGWYTVPVTTMYAEDGRTETVPKSAVEDWKKVGWYESTVTMYAPDGRTENIPFNELQAWKNVGWYTYPVTTMYAVSGRTAVAPSSEVSNWEKDGWYTYPVVIMYSAYSGSKVIPNSEAASWEEDGWRYVPMTLMYSQNGEKIAIPVSEVSAYEKVGWYKNSVDADYGRFLQRYNELIGEKNYSGAMGLCELHLSLALGTTQYAQNLYKLKSEAMDKWRASVGKPVVVTDAWVDTSKRDIRKVRFTFKNIGYKTIKAVRISFKCYDVFNEYVKTCEDYYTENAWISVGETFTSTWNTNDCHTYEVKDIKVTAVTFAVGDEVVRY